MEACGSDQAHKLISSGQHATAKISKNYILMLLSGVLSSEISPITLVVKLIGVGISQIVFIIIDYRSHCNGSLIFGTSSLCQALLI